MESASGSSTAPWPRATLAPAARSLWASETVATNMGPGDIIAGRETAAVRRSREGSSGSATAPHRVGAPPRPPSARQWVLKSSAALAICSG